MVSPRSSLLVDISLGGNLKNEISYGSSKGAPNVNLFDFMFLLVDFGKNLCSLADKLQQNLNASVREEELYSTKVDCFVVD